MIDQTTIAKIIDCQIESGYDFNPGILSEADLRQVRQTSRQARCGIQNAPLGRLIFSYLQSMHPDIQYEVGYFNSDIDAMIYMPNQDNKLAFIILNGNKPLVNQIFACAHEYYHYLSDMADIHLSPIACFLSSPENNLREHKASRFAAEFLLPGDALACFIENFQAKYNLDQTSIDSLIMLTKELTLTYEMPVKAILYRLKEERYFQNLLKNIVPLYEPLKKSIFLLSKQSPVRFAELFETPNNYVEDPIYMIAPTVYQRGFVTYERLEEDMKRLGITMDTLGLQAPSFDPGEEDDS